MSGFLMVLMALWFAWEAVRAIRTGELRGKGGVIRRSDSPVIFSLLIGLLLLIVAAVLDITFEFWLTATLINFKL